jgi:hypothetical protein
LEWSLKQTCSSSRDLSNGVSHFTCMHRGRVDSWLLMVWSQIGNLIFDPFFCHNLCCRCPNGPCEPIFDIYISLSFQWYKEHTNAKYFDHCNRTLKFLESKRTPKSQFRECEFHPHTLSKWGCNIVFMDHKGSTSLSISSLGINKQNKWINEENKNSKQFYNLLQIGRKKKIRKLQATLFYRLHKTKWREQWKIVKEKQA